MRCEECAKCVFCKSFKEQINKIIDKINSRDKCYPADDSAYCQTVLAALKTLQMAGYIYEGGAELWLPPIGTRPDLENLDKLRAELGYWRERCLLAEKQLGVS